MPHNLPPVIATGIQFVRRQQRADGGFDGLASAYPTSFQKARVHPTIFFTALISQACTGLAAAQPITRAADAFLLDHKSPYWTWNYWQRGTVASHLPRYPDDLDDTACALAALASHNETVLDGEVLGFIGRHLVSAETQLSGPYQTWLVPNELLDTWHDIDVAVNANIAFLLSVANVTAPGLEHYLTQALRHDQLRSSYYLGILPTLYFMTRVKKLSRHKQLRQRLELELQTEPASRNVLMNTLLLAAAVRANCKRRSLLPVVDELIRSQQTDGSWPAGALYVEPVIDGVPYYAGSAALTTAFACEALALYAHGTVQAKPVRPVHPSTVSKALRAAQGFSTTIAQPDLQYNYQQALSGIAQHDTNQQICAPATHLHAAVGGKLSAAVLEQLDLASINGWIAYSIYDDFLDGESDPVRLSTANLALRCCLGAFQLALPAHPSFQALVQTTLDTVDGANSWETAHARSIVKGAIITSESLPDYEDYGQLADRSWGHVLASTGVLLAHGYSPNSSEVQAWHTFFRHYLIARQLNDDAHDWQADLAQGQLSAVVCALLADRPLPLKLNLAVTLPKLRRQFWEETVEEVCRLIMEHLTKARSALARCSFLIDSTPYEQWLDALAAAVQATNDGRQEATAFQRSFETSL